MSQTKHNLPKLRAGHNLRGLDEAGRWMSINIDLDSLAKALPVDETKAFTDQDEPIRAIPDPWAQATAFGEALRNPKHSMHARALSEWRGLIAIMALQYQHKGDFTLHPQAVDLDDHSMFANVMTTLTPEVALAGQAALWRKPTLIMMAEASDPTGMFAKPIAMTNPICLIAPGRTTARTIVPKVDWAQGRLQCPFSAGQPTRSVAELSILLHFLGGLVHTMRQLTGEVAADITQLLINFAQDVRERLGREPFASLPVENVQSALPPLFRPLFNAVTLDDGGLDEAVSEAMLSALPMPVASDGRAAMKGFILADPAVAEALGKDMSHVMVWKRHSLAEVLRSDAKFAEVRAQALSAGYMLLTIDDLLTDRAARFKKKALIESHPMGLQDMLLPLRPLVLLLAASEHGTPPAEVLAGRVRGQVSGDRASFTLTVRLEGGPSGGGIGVPLTRHYSANPLTGEGQLVDNEDWDIYNCQLWPNYRSPAWHSYMARFYYHAGLQSKMARPQQAVSIAILHDLIASASDLANADIALRACNRGEPLSDRRVGEGQILLKSAHRLTAKNNAFFEEVQFSKAPFDAIYYTDSLGDARAKKPVGMVLITLEQKAAPVGRTKVAIDFGTTNTVGAYGEWSAEPVRFQNRLVFPIKPADQMVREQAIHASRNQFVGFMPPEARKTPIPSVAKPKQPYNAQETLWAFRNLIYFHTSQPPAQGAEARELADFLDATSDAKFNLKWSNDAETRDAAKDFLTQFIVMTAAEMLAANYDPSASHWHFSIPESMGETQRAEFENNIRDSMPAIGLIGGAGEATRPQGQIAPLQSEGLSAANYMLQHGGFSKDKLNIILDIGGGTTDMTIWDREHAVWKGSIRLAGGNFFTETMVNNTQILQGLGLESWAKSLTASPQDFVGDREAKRRQLAEMLFSGRTAEDGNGPDLQASLRDHWSRVTSQLGNPLRHAALTYLAGIAWYNGLVVRHLSGGASPLIDADVIHDPAFAVCGRGGGLFNMLHGRRGPDDRTEITRALSVFGHAVGTPIDAGTRVPHPRFSASAAPKLEVVRGMLTDHGDIDTSASGMAGLGTILPLGLDLVTVEGTMAADEILTLATFEARLKSVDLTQFKRFLSALEACAGLSIDIDRDKSENAARVIAAKTMETLIQKQNQVASTAKVQAGRIAMEPPFLIALRALIALMAAPMGKRDAKLAVVTED